MVDTSVTKHFEILRGVPIGCVFILRSVKHTNAIQRLLRNAVDHLRLRNFRCFQNGGRYVVYMVPLMTDFTFCIKSGRPVHNHAVSGPTEIGSHLLRPFKRGIGSNRPSR